MKSHVSELLLLAEKIFMDLTAKCADVSLEKRDLETIKSRVKHEGLSFLTITLPDFGQDFDEALSIGQIEPTHFRSFRKWGKAPAFMRGIFARVFDEDGRIRNEPDIAAIEGIRQCAYLFKKVLVPCTPQRVRRALAQFKTQEQVFSTPLAQDDIDIFVNVSRVMWSRIFGGKDFLHNTIPKHGPGATAERLSGNTKFLSSRWHERLEPYFPLLDYAFANVDARFSEEFENVTLVLEDDEQPVRIVTVPKSLKTPRIIAIEPVCMQYTQQALSEVLVEALETSWLTAGHVNFSDQSINQELAINSSKDGKFATVDLSSASDLVPYELALSMFDSNPDFQDAISACRSKRAQLPDGSIMELRKFASMGSALCFPIEAMYFYTICVAALLKEHNLPITEPNIYKMSRSVYVYGDDIIIPTHMSAVVIETLQKYYCRVNTDKSYWTGKFRESCGMEAYDGEEVTPTYLRQMPPDNKRSTNRLISWLATSNLFYRKGYWHASSFLLARVEQILGTLPIVRETSAGLGKHSFQAYHSVGRWNEKLQRPEVRTWVASPVYKRDPLDGTQALLKCLLSMERSYKHESTGSLMPRDLVQRSDHLQRTARPGTVALKRRWVQPY